MDYLSPIIIRKKNEINMYLYKMSCKVKKYTMSQYDFHCDVKGSVRLIYPTPLFHTAESYPTLSVMRKRHILVLWLCPPSIYTYVVVWLELIPYNLFPLSYKYVLHYCVGRCNLTILWFLFFIICIITWNKKSIRQCN